MVYATPSTVLAAPLHTRRPHSHTSRKGGRGQSQDDRRIASFEKSKMESQIGPEVERGVDGSDTKTRGRSPVVLEVRFRSRAFSIAEIQSEIVLGYFSITSILIAGGTFSFAS